jgi:pimeloyl-ACP methyl ester carboxylesterase
VLKDLEVYRDLAPPEDYSITTEIDGLDRTADEAGFNRFHLYGHSAGGAIALAYVAARPHRVLSLAVDEPAMDFTEEGNRTYGWDGFDHALTLPPAEAMREFMRLQIGQESNCPRRPDHHRPGWQTVPPAFRRSSPRRAATGWNPTPIAGFQRLCTSPWAAAAIRDGSASETG